MMLIFTSTSAYYLKQESKIAKLKILFHFENNYFQIYMYVQAAYMNSVSWEPRHYISIIDLCLQKPQLLNIFKSSCCFLMSNCVDGRPNFTITKQFLGHWLVESYVWYKYSPWKTMEMMRWWHLFFSFSPVHFPEKLQWKWTSKPSMSLLKAN